MNRDEFSRRLATVGAVLKSEPTIRDILTPAEEAFLEAIMSVCPADATVGSILADDESEMAATVLAKLEAMPRHIWPSFALWFYPDDFGL